MASVETLAEQMMEHGADRTSLVIGFGGVVLLFSEKLAAYFSTSGDNTELSGMVLIMARRTLQRCLYGNVLIN